jgi:hypothetical protein
MACERIARTHSVCTDATCTLAIGRGSMPAWMMPWRTPLALNFALVCWMISRRCASANTDRCCSTYRLMISQNTTVLPLPVGATSSNRF